MDYEQQRDEVKLRYEALMSSGLGELALERLVIYPIKSCDGFEITEGLDIFSLADDIQVDGLLDLMVFCMTENGLL